MKGRLHSPHTGTGKERRQSSGKAPGGIAASWPTEGRMPFNSQGLRRKAVRVNKDCETDTTPHRTLVTKWMRDKWTYEQAATFVRTRQNGDSLHQRALGIYEKMAEAGAIEWGEGGVGFPVTARDFTKAAASSILEHIK